jgi:hypothetical protein
LNNQGLFKLLVKEKPMMRRMLASILCLSFLALSSTTRGRSSEEERANSLRKSENICFVLSDEGNAPLLALPKGKGAWRIEISRSGGMRPVKETVQLNSTGEINVLSEQMRGGKTTLNCSRKEKLSARELLKINAAITAAKPSTWKDGYSDPQHPICCDQPTTEVKLERRGDKGQEETSTSWYPGSYSLVPSDLKAITTFIQPQWDAIRDHCDK